MTFLRAWQERYQSIPTRGEQTQRHYSCAGCPMLNCVCAHIHMNQKSMVEMMTMPVMRNHSARYRQTARMSLGSTRRIQLSESPLIMINKQALVRAALPRISGLTIFYPFTCVLNGS